MKQSALFLSVYLLLLFSLNVGAQEEIVVGEINWQEKARRLTYDMTKEGLVKIRVGSYAGPVYRTIVNLEKRETGKNQEHWSGEDETGKIDFLKYGKVHFCVGIPINPIPDAQLDIKFTDSKDAVRVVTIDMPKDLRTLFVRHPAELRVYVDNKLKKIEKVNSLPYTFNLTDISEGTHLVVINLWKALDFDAVAYKAFEMSVKPKEESSKAQAEPGSSEKGKIVFCKQDEAGIWQIFTCALDCQYITQLTKSPIDKRYPSYSPDGKNIAYVNNLGELWIMDAFGSNNRKIPLPINCSEPKFSPDGNRLIFTCLEDVYHGSAKVWDVDLQTMQLKKLVNRPWLQYNPTYSPDQTEILFTDGPELSGQDIRKLDLETGNITQITDNGPYDYDIHAAFLNSGQEIVYSTNEDGNYEIYKMDKFGRDKKNLSQSPQSSDMMPRVSKDDRKIFFLSDRTGSLQIWQMNLDGSKSQQITKGKSDINSFSVWTE